MRGIVLAGGSGSRLAPLTRVTNKHLLPVGREPMIFHPVRKLIEAGLQDIIVVTGREHMGAVVSLLGSGSELGCRFTYQVQDQAGGIAEALGLCERNVGGDSMVVILGDNVFSGSIKGPVSRFAVQGGGARVLLHEVPDPQRYGVAELSAERVLRIHEKPQTPPSRFAVTGIYMYDHRVFELVRGLSRSARGELEITDVNNGYIARDELHFEVLEGWWTDAGTHDSYVRANRMVNAQLEAFPELVER